MNLINDIVALSEEMQQWRRHIHAHPELAFKAICLGKMFGRTQQHAGMPIMATGMHNAWVF